MLDPRPLTSDHIAKLATILGAQIPDDAGLQEVAKLWISPNAAVGAKKQYAASARKLLKIIRKFEMEAWSPGSSGHNLLVEDLWVSNFSIGDRTDISTQEVIMLVRRRIIELIAQNRSNHGWFDTKVSRILVAKLLLVYADLGGKLTVAGTEPDPDVEKINNITFKFVRAFVEMVVDLSVQGNQESTEDEEHRLKLLKSLRGRRPAAWVTLLLEARDLAKKMKHGLPGAYDLVGGNIVQLAS